MDVEKIVEFARRNPQIPSGEVAQKFQELQGKQAINAQGSWEVITTRVGYRVERGKCQSLLSISLSIVCFHPLDILLYLTNFN